ncbi:lytic polysaccharide monooxygenase [Providencia sp.]|uniref:lytic polysaccharide monooxygenase n=1 Tax=Providencia sp. TaxID=589 RepID=UPI000E924328|nr:lytic polysaccharide monooxygenase [Providencia sp.]MBP6080374.1 lytic polysaccharide monooxygenase [Providencia sp.]HBO22049.1 aminopeptidase [Providencia sp.]
MKQFLLLPLLLCCSFLVWSHGYVESPASRAYQCKLKNNIDCGPVQYEPQSVEGLKGFPQQGPADGHLASAGIARFYPIDLQETSRWKHNKINQSNVDFYWRLTAVHKTSKWEYFITNPNWDASQPLSRSQFNLTPFCKVEKLEIPEAQVHHRCDLPKNYNGYHVILAVWTISDTQNAFYQAIDIDINYELLK